MTLISIKYQPQEFRAVWIFPKRDGIFTSISIWNWVPTKLTWANHQLCASYSHYKCFCGDK